MVTLRYVRSDSVVNVASLWCEKNNRLSLVNSKNPMIVKVLIFHNLGKFFDC